MRNRKSHGNQSSLDPYEKDYLTDYEKQCLINWRKELYNLVKHYNEKHEIKIKFEYNRIKPGKLGWKNLPDNISNLYNNKFSELQWVSEECFKDVHDFLRIIASTCAKELKK